MLIPFLLSFVYFFFKAYKAKENYWVYGILGSVSVGFLTMLLTWVLKVAIYREGGLGIDRSTATVIGVIVILVSIWVVDKYSGLNWYDKTNDKLNEKITDSDNISEEEMEKLKAGNIIKDIDIIQKEE
ncbi:MAG: hypothetical protein IPM92_04305 [Saprospiraceae bacterium]|nr:hypothetical protein [Saprospiraceae bacterium]